LTKRHDEFTTFLRSKQDITPTRSRAAELFIDKMAIIELGRIIYLTQVIPKRTLEM